MAEENAAGTEESSQQFAMQHVYVKDMSFESPAAPEIFKQQFQPSVNMELNTKAEKLNDTEFEVVLTITITVKSQEDAAFLVEVQQAGIFLVAGFEDQQLAPLLGIAAPNMLFPYAREAVDSLAVKGGFPPLALRPVNFEHLFRQAQLQAQQQQEQGGDSTAH